MQGWAKAWSAKDVKGYLAHYAFDFEVPGGMTRAAWEKERADRIERPKSIDVTVKVLNAQASDSEATVTFRQSYKSDTLKSHNTKTETFSRRRSVYSFVLPAMAKENKKTPKAQNSVERR